MTFPECSPVLGKEVPHMSVHLVLALHFYQHGPPLKLMQKDVVIFGQILTIEHLQLLGHYSLLKTSQILSVSASIIGCGKILQLSTLTSMVYACSH